MSSVLPVSDAARVDFKETTYFLHDRHSACDYFISVLSKQLLSIPRLKSTALELMFFYIDRLLGLPWVFWSVVAKLLPVLLVWQLIRHKKVVLNLIFLGLKPAEQNPCYTGSLTLHSPKIYAPKFCNSYLLQILAANNFCKQNDFMKCRITSLTILFVLWWLYCMGKVVFQCFSNTICMCLLLCWPFRMKRGEGKVIQFNPFIFFCLFFSFISLHSCSLA